MAHLVGSVPVLIPFDTGMEGFGIAMRVVRPCEIGLPGFWQHFEVGGCCDACAFFAVACPAEQLQVVEVVCSASCDRDDVVDFDDDFVAVSSAELAG